MIESIIYAQGLMRRGLSPDAAARASGLYAPTLRNLIASTVPSVPEPQDAPAPAAPVPYERLRFVRPDDLSPRDVMRSVVKEVAQRHGLTLADLLAPDAAGMRTRTMCRARHEAMDAVNQAFPELSTVALGRFFGGRDHSTVISAIRAHRARVSASAVVR